MSTDQQVWLKRLVDTHHQIGMDILKKKRRKSEELGLAMRHFMCAWVLDEVTHEQLFEIVDKYKRSPFN